MSRRGSRGRRAARRQAQDRRDRAFEDWLKFREQADQREVEALERELRRLAQRPGWRVHA
jgi:plasmid stabilization system protein ParE